MSERVRPDDRARRPHPADQDRSSGTGRHRRPSAAGKTTLANRLADVLRAGPGRTVIRAELDHFMRMVEDRNAYPYDSPESYYLDAWDYPAIRAGLLEPLGPGGEPPLHARSGRPGAGGADDAILLADGVFLQRPELDACWDLRIYLHVRRPSRCAVPSSATGTGWAARRRPSARYRTKYLPGEQRYLTEVRPRERAQIVIAAALLRSA